MLKKKKNITLILLEITSLCIATKKDYGVSNLKLQKLLYFVQAFS